MLKKITLISLAVSFIVSQSFAQYAIEEVALATPIEIESSAETLPIREVDKIGDIKVYCFDNYVKHGYCAREYCDLICKPTADPQVCNLTCIDKPCLALKSENCPIDKCDILEGCNGKKVCFDKQTSAAPDCGTLGYDGQEAECCPGLIRRCGIDFSDGRCDMEGKNSVYSVAICIPCGNGICNQFENKCNCPEDCK